MKCPVDGETLAMSDRNGGLDRGEFDKIIERSAAETPPPMASADRGGDRNRDRPRKKKRGGFPDALFDFARVGPARRNFNAPPARGGIHFVG